MTTKRLSQAQWYTLGFIDARRQVAKHRMPKEHHKRLTKLIELRLVLLSDDVYRLTPSGALALRTWEYTLQDAAPPEVAGEAAHPGWVPGAPQNPQPQTGEA